MTIIYGEGFVLKTEWNVREFGGAVYIENPLDENDVIFIDKRLVKGISRD